MNLSLNMHRYGAHVLLDTGRRFWMLFLWPGIPRLHYQNRRSDRRWIFPQYPPMKEPF